MDVGADRGQVDDERAWVAALSVAGLLTQREDRKVEVRDGLRLLDVHRVDVVDRLDGDRDALSDLTSVLAPTS